MASTPKPTAPGGHTAAPGAPTGAHTAVPADPHHGEHGGFPPFDPTTFAPQLVWLALTFGLLYLVMSRIALPKVAAVLGARKERIQRDLAEAERLKGETDSALAAYEKSLTDARGQAQGLAKETRDRMAAEMDRERHRSDAANAAKLAETETRIADTKTRALANVDQIAAETASAIVERLIGHQLTPDEIRRAAAVARS